MQYNACANLQLMQFYLLSLRNDLRKTKLDYICKLSTFFHTPCARAIRNVAEFEILSKVMGKFH